VRLRRGHLSAALGVLVAAALLASAPLALAAFTHTTSGGPLTMVSGTLSPASGVSAAQAKCHTNHTPEIEISFTATSSSYATSYTVERATASAGPYTSVTSIALGGATSYTDTSGSLGYSTTYYYRVAVLFHSWSATSATASIRTLSKSCQ